MKSRTQFGFFVLATSVLAAAVGCGGGGSSKTSSPPPPPATYTIGGNISGLTASNLVLQDNGGNNLTVSANAATFVFSTALASGATYSVTILTQPTGESCSVSGGTGTAAANVTNVSIACKQAYTVGGQVFGLGGSGLVLQDNGGNNLTVSAGATNYAFTFDGQIPSGGAPYSITSISVPSGQTCAISNPIGTATADVTDADITCTNLTGTGYTIGGSITGLNAQGPILQDSLGVNNIDLLQVTANGNFTFADPVASGSAYDVSVLTQPMGRNCVVSSGAGTATANVANVGVICVGDWTWEGGSSTVGKNGGQLGIYGTLGQAAAANIPGGRQQSLTWTDSSGALWLFGGYAVDSTGANGLSNDLWKFEPGQGSPGQWAWMGGSNVVTPSTSFGAAGAPGVYGTLGSAAATNVPGGREEVASWTDASGDIWVFGGEGIDANGVTGQLNDLWKFDPKQGANGEWIWMGGSNSVGNAFGGPSGVYGTLGTAAAANQPGGRYGAISWVDSLGNFWMFGGDAEDSVGTFGYMNDLWKYTPGANGTAGEWTWMAGSNVVGNNGNGAPGVYGTLGAPETTNSPGARSNAMSWVDPSGNVWMFGGLGADSLGSQGFLNDLWEYLPTANGAAGAWAWMGGSNVLPGPGVGQSGVYGSVGVAAAANVPGARFSGAAWVDASGNFWMFGGDGYDSTGLSGYLNDLWEFDRSLGATGEWKWMGGDNQVGRAGGQTGGYGTLGTPGASNIPGGRYGLPGWVDKSGNFWLFGGEGYDSVGNQGYLNDLWQYQP